MTIRVLVAMSVLLFWLHMVIHIASPGMLLLHGIWAVAIPPLAKYSNKGG